MSLLVPLIIRIGPNRCLTITKKDCKRQLVTWLTLGSDSLSVLNDLVQRFPTSSYCADLQSSELLEPGQSAHSHCSPAIQYDFTATPTQEYFQSSAQKTLVFHLSEQWNQNLAKQFNLSSNLSPPAPGLLVLFG